MAWKEACASFPWDFAFTGEVGGSSFSSLPLFHLAQSLLEQMGWKLPMTQPLTERKNPGEERTPGGRAEPSEVRHCGPMA